MRSFFFAATMIVFNSGYVCATSDVHVRYPAISSLGSCKGSLVEKVFEGSSVTWSTASFAAACFTNSTHADWVIVSGADCGQITGQIACDHPSQKSTMKKFGQISSFGTNEARFVLLNDAIKGVDCTLNLAKDNEGSWSCASYEPITSLRLENASTKFTTIAGENRPVKLYGKMFDFPTTFPNNWRQARGKQVAQNNVSPKVAYVGLWSTKVAWCKNTGADTDEVPATYTASTITGYEHQCKFTKISSIGSEWTVSARCAGEGNSWNYNFRMSVSDDIMVVTDLDKKRRATYRQYRCSP